MSSPLNQYQNMANGLISYYGRTNDFDAFRVDYEGNTESDLFSATALRLDPKGAKNSVMNALPGVVYMVVSGMKDVLLSGDRLAPVIADGSTPISTVIQNTDMSDCVAIRTGRLGSIENTQRDLAPVYPVVYFDYVSVSGPTVAEIAGFEESKRFETNRAVIYTRNLVKKGQRLIDTATGRRNLILATAGTGNHMLLQIQGDPR